MNQPNAILAISSTDRYTSSKNGNQDQPFDNALGAEYSNLQPLSNDFSIISSGALINGYINKIIVSQIQLQYNLPTIQAFNNDNFVLYIERSVGSSEFLPFAMTLPYGFYTPDELATMLEVQLNNVTNVPLGFTVIYSQGDPNTIGNNANSPTFYSFSGFIILSNKNLRIRLPEVVVVNGVRVNELVYDNRLLYNQQQLATALKTYKLFGFNILNTNPQLSQRSFTAPSFLYTPYIDIYSDALTNYQRLKDTDSSTSKRKGLVSRIYLSSGYSVQTTLPNGALGTAPFVATYDFNTPKVVEWTPDTAVNSLDFQLRDCYGELLFTTAIVNTTPKNYLTEVFNTEFQMTLLCVED